MLKLDNRKSALPVYISFFLVLSVLINIVEFFIPRPIPYIKPGFANIPVLLTIYLCGGVFGVIVSGMKSIFASLILGYFMSVPFYLSFFGSVGSSAVMGLLRHTLPGISAYSISVWGAVTHSIVQLILIFTFLIKSSIIFINLLPMLIFSVVTGVLNGYVCLYLLRVINVYQKGHNN